MHGAVIPDSHASFHLFCKMHVSCCRLSLYTVGFVCAGPVSQVTSCVTDTVCNFCAVDVLRKHGHYIAGEPLRMSSSLDFEVTGRL